MNLPTTNIYCAQAVQQDVAILLSRLKTKVHPAGAPPTGVCHAARAGSDNAAALLGVMYDGGLGVPRDYAEAAKWYRLAADQGNARAELSLGAMYAEGQGVPKDDVLAYMWFNLAAAQAVNYAARYRDLVAQRMTPEEIA